MADKNSPSLLTLSVELIFRILDNLHESTILFSMHNVCAQLNTTTDAYHRYQAFTTLGLTNNHIGADGAQRVAETLRNNTTITTLKLGGNQLGDKGAQYLAYALRNNTVTFIFFSFLR
ncbi:unnamed protein product [Rotaria magnacalcarata]|uniref:Uncharacterized protein n=1 Tax=Rotaria magnacalcarata TaxID=392030 RepID=A0A820Q1Y2_9BILA|nr:unnamed protein product [Rotaria magnacalcarata]